MHAGLRNLISLPLAIGCLQSIRAQPPPPQHGVARIIASVDSFNRKFPAEQLFLHFDKPYYAIGDTIWFKAYLFQAASHAWSPLSALLYVDIINDSSKQLTRMALPLNFGVAWGQIPLTGEDLRDGSYTIRAYTRWMENFGEDYYYARHFTIAPATIQRLNARQLLSQGKGRKVTGQHSAADDQQSAGNGNQSAGYGNQSAVNRYQPAVQGKIDLQFMPEGGYLVAGIPTRVGFKAIGEDGLGVDCKGRVLDKDGQTVAVFQSLHKGMGVFELEPVKGQSYSAEITVAGRGVENFPLPSAKRSGVVLRVDNQLQDDSIRFSIRLSDDLVNNKTYHLVALSRGVACYGANFTLNKQTITGAVGKGAFPTGIAHFTLFNEKDEPVIERMTFIDQGDNLHINWKTDQAVYHTKDSIPLHILVTDATGKGIGGSFSMAITDDAQVHQDSADRDNIVARMLLTADLKGYIETPGWYFNHPGPQYEALDALLLTQGWTGYNWQQIMREELPAPAFAAEPFTAVTGKVTGLLGAPVKDAHVVLMGMGRNQFAMDTTTDRDGRFAFTPLPPYDSVNFIVQARTAKGKSAGLGISIDEFKQPAIPHFLPVNSYPQNGDSTLVHYVRENEVMLSEKGPYGGSAKVLQPVIVKAPMVIKGSQNLNGPGQADQVIDETAIGKAGKITLRELLLKTVKGFHFFYSPDGMEHYKLLQYNIRFVIDGVHLSRFGNERETLEFLSSDDISGIEVMYNMRYVSTYTNNFVHGQGATNPKKEYAYIEITTRSGNGIFMSRSPGVATSKPIAVTWPRVFYMPRYPVTGTGQVPDLRSTIDWVPNLLSDHQGKIETSFFSAATPGTYTLIIQGSDMDGNIGYSIGRITIGN